MSRTLGVNLKLHPLSILNSRALPKMVKKKLSLRSKAANFVSDLTTVIFNPISDNSDSPHTFSDNEAEARAGSGRSQLQSEQSVIGEEKPEGLVDGPDTSSFTAFLYSLLASESGEAQNRDQQDVVLEKAEPNNPTSNSAMKENGGSGRRSLVSKGKQKLSRAVFQAARIGGYRYYQEGNSDPKIDGDDDLKPATVEVKHVVRVEKIEDSPAMNGLAGISEPSMLLSENTRHALYASLPALVQGRKWLLLYSTWRHGISLSTLYRRSMLWPGLSLLVVGDRGGATFGGLIEAPLKPTNKKKYQGTNETFVFTDRPGHPVIFRPTGVNRYFTLCSLDFLAIGGGSHFALYLDSDLLNGSSSVSETYDNPCLANSEEFDVKQVELWGFVYPSKYEEILALSRQEAPGICRW